MQRHCSKPAMQRSSGSAERPADHSPLGARFPKYVPLVRSHPPSANSAAQPATQDSAVPQEASYSNTLCLECGYSITTRPRDVWWTTLLVPQSQMSRRPMCCAACLLEYLSAIYCPHLAMEIRLRDRMWAQLSKAWKLSTNTTGDSSGNCLDSNSVSSAEQPASDSGAAQLVSAIPGELLLRIVRFVGAHNLETIWTCSECKPYWYNWYCDECQMVNRFLHWSPRLHYGHCGQSCDCCRSANREVFPCEFCDDLWNLKGTCQTMRDLVKTYNAT